MKNDIGGDYCTVDSSAACAKLGISRGTLYAYVSRRLVRAIAHPNDARRSLYDRRDIDMLAARKRRGRSRRAVAESTIHWGDPVLTSKITRIADGGYFYRGANAVELAETLTLEAVLAMIADVRCKPSMRSRRRFTPSRDLSPFNRIVRMMAEEATSDRPGDGRPRAGRIMRLTALSATAVPDDRDIPMHALLAHAWSNDARAPDLIRRALVLCADHELNASTYAARVAASAGATLPAALLAGLATLSGTGHGGATTRCRAWMDAMDDKSAAACSAALSTTGKPPPGFGHPLYPDGDPRAAALLRHCRISTRWSRIIRRVRDATGSHPALDFGLAFLERELELPAGAGLGIFAVGRTAGWIAHIFEQRQTGALIRPRASVDG